MATLDELKVVITGDASRLTSELRKASAATKQAGSEMSSSMRYTKDAFLALAPALGAAAVVGALKNFAVNAVNAAGHMNDLADRIGFVASTLSALEAKLAANGASLDDFGNAVNLMNANVGQAVSGNQELVKDFDRLGLSVNKLKALSPEDQFYAITDALAKVGSQYEQTEIGRAIFGRGFAALIPTIKEANGNLAEHVQTLKATKEALSDDTIQRIDAFGDALSTAAIQSKNAFLETFAAILQVTSAVRQGFAEQGGYQNAKIGGPGSIGNPGRSLTPEEFYAAKAKAGGYATEATFAANKKASAKGSNAGLLKPAGDQKELAIPDYDEGEFQKYLNDLDSETEALALSERALTVRKTVIQAQDKAQQDYNKGLRDSPLLYDEERAGIESLSGRFYDLRKAQQESQRQAEQWKDQLTDGLTDIILHFDNATEAAGRFFDEIASQILKKTVTGPLAQGITDAVGGPGVFSGIGKLLGFADGGSPPVGVPSIVGERGPEIFVPNSAGTIIPNGGLGGSVSVTQNFNMSPGLQGTVEAEVRRAAPSIMAATKAAVFASIERGGPESRSVNRRS